MIPLSPEARVHVIDRLNWALQRAATKASASESASDLRWRTIGYYGTLDAALLAALRKKLVDCSLAPNAAEWEVVVAQVRSARAELGQAARAALREIAEATTGSSEVTSLVQRRVRKIVKARGAFPLIGGLRLVALDGRSWALQRRVVVSGGSPRWRDKANGRGKGHWETLGYYGPLEHAFQAALDKSLVELHLRDPAPVPCGDVLERVRSIGTDLVASCRESLGRLLQEMAPPAYPATSSPDAPQVSP